MDCMPITTQKPSLMCALANRTIDGTFMARANCKKKRWWQLQNMVLLRVRPFSSIKPRSAKTRRILSKEASAVAHHLTAASYCFVSSSSKVPVEKSRCQERLRRRGNPEFHCQVFYATYRLVKKSKGKENRGGGGRAKEIIHSMTSKLAP